MVQQPSREVGRVCEAVHVDPVVARDVRRQDPLDVRVGLARVNHEWLAQEDSKVDLPNQDLLLDITGGIVVMVVQAHLAPRKALGVRVDFNELRFDRIVVVASVVGMNT